MSNKKCRYEDCPEGHPVAGKDEQVTCGSCRADLGLPVINTIFDLAREVSAQRDGSEGEGAEEVGKSIARRLYKDTECGVSFWSDCERVVVTGYCEGSDWHIEGRELPFPFTPEEFWETVKAADQDGCDTWDETHGCDDCGTENEYGVISVNPDCKTCGGSGAIL